MLIMKLLFMVLQIIIFKLCLIPQGLGLINKRSININIIIVVSMSLGF